MNRFTGNIENFKPMTGIVLINSMLINLETQKILMITNKCNVFNLISNLQHIKVIFFSHLSKTKLFQFFSFVNTRTFLYTKNNCNDIVRI